MAVASMSFMALLFLIFAEPLTGLFIEDTRVIGWGTYCVMLAAFEQPTIALTYVWGGALRGAGAGPGAGLAAKLAGGGAES